MFLTIKCFTIIFYNINPFCGILVLNTLLHINTFPSPVIHPMLLERWYEPTHRINQSQWGPLPLVGTFHSLQRGVLCMNQETGVHCSRIAVHWTVQNWVASTRSMRVRSALKPTTLTDREREGIREKRRERYHHKRNTARVRNWVQLRKEGKKGQK